MKKSPCVNIIYNFILTSPAVSCTSRSSNLNSLWDGRSVSVQQLFYRALLTGFVQNSMYNSCIVLMRFSCIHVVYPYSSNDPVTDLKKSRFILLDRSDKDMIDNQSIAFLIFTRRILTSLSVDEMLLLRYGNWCPNSKLWTSYFLSGIQALVSLPQSGFYISIEIETNLKG